MNVIGSLRKQLKTTSLDVRGHDEKTEVTVVENQRFSEAAQTWSFRNLLRNDPKRYSLFLQILLRY
jgi:hypothetical protein